MTPHFAYPLLVLLSVLILPALVLMPATSVKTMALVDLPLCMATTGSLAAFYMLAESAQGRRRTGALKRLPMLIAIGTGLAPHLSIAVWEGLRSMAGEFVRTPKQGNNKNRYKAAIQLPYAEALLSLWSAASVAASISTGHYFATPFAVLFTLGYAYVTYTLTSEQVMRARPSAALEPALAAPARAAALEPAPIIAVAADDGRISDTGVPQSGERAIAAAADDAVAA